MIIGFNSLVSYSIQKDDYQKAAVEKYVADFNDSRLHFEEKNNYKNVKGWCLVEVSISDFSSKEEMAQVLYDFVQYIRKKPPFVNYNGKSYEYFFEIDFSIKGINGSEWFEIKRGFDSSKDILKEIEDLY